MLRKFAKIATVVAGVSTVLFGAEKKFDMYGFIDFQAGKLVVDDNNPLTMEGFDDAFRFRVGNVHLYNDFRPHAKVRTLIETGFHWQPHGEYSPGLMTNVKMGDQIVQSLVVSSPDKQTSTVNLTTRGEIPVSQVAIHRAWMEYNLSQYANIRVGKFITPAGIWNVEHGSPVILTVRQPFQTGMIEVFPKAQTGIMERGTAYIGSFDLDYSVYLSSGRDVQTINELKDVAAGGNLKFKAVDIGLEAGISAYTGIEKDESRYAIINNHMVLDQNGNPVLDADFNPIMTPLNKDGIMEITDTIIYETKSREHCFGVDAKWNYKGVLLQGEFNYNKLKNQLMGGAETTVKAVYGLAGYKFRVNPKFSVSPYFLYEFIRGENAFDRTTGKAVNPVNIISTGFVDDLGTISGGINMNLFTNTYLKMEYAWLNFDRNDPEITDLQNDAQDFGAISVQLSVAF